MYQLTRDLHLYFGLFSSPFVIAFALSVFFLNHAKVAVDAAPMRLVHDLQVPSGFETAQGTEAIGLAKAILAQVGVAGEIGFIRHVHNERHVIIPVSKPRLETTIEIDLSARTASVARRRMSFLEALAYLHKSPGPHNANIRGNWLWTRIWRWLSDGTIYLILFLSVSGVYLWLALRAERAVGLTLLTGGALSVLGFLYALAF